MKNKLNFLLAIAAIFVFVNQADASDTTDTGRVSAVVELTDGELQSLLNTGSLKMSIPPRLKNKVNSLILKRPDRFKDDVAVLFNDIDKRNDTISISVDDSTIEQIAYQPVELKIYESGYTNILVSYRRGNGMTPQKPSKTDSVELKIQLNNGKSITGRLSYMTQFPLKSGLGKVKVKLDEISQITFDQDGNLRVVMLNGDTLQGESNFSSVIVNTRWGQERIKTRDIASITPPQANASSVLDSMTHSNRAHAPLPNAISQPVYGQPVYGYHSLHAPQPQQQYNTYGGHGYYDQTVIPSQNGIFSGSDSLGTVPLNQVPISDQPVIDSLIGQPLPMMTPNQANESWLFPQN